MKHFFAPDFLLALFVITWVYSFHLWTEHKRKLDSKIEIIGQSAMDAIYNLKRLKNPKDRVTAFTLYLIDNDFDVMVSVHLLDKE